MNTKSLPVYHETVNTIYYDVGDGRLVQVWKNSNPRLERTLCHLKNDEQGQSFFKALKRSFKGKIRKFYRCPSTGKTYDKQNNSGFSRNGWVHKSAALVINVNASVVK